MTRAKEFVSALEKCLFADARSCSGRKIALHFSCATDAVDMSIDLAA